MIIDYSAHSAWMECPALWYEKYITRLRKRWPTALRTDALCLGSLVHEGLRIWQTTQTLSIPDSVQEEMTPAPETLNLAYELVHGYTQHYPAEQWELINCEAPLTFPLPNGHTGLAKLDAYFYVKEFTTINGGPEGTELVLTPGWYIHEYKTKGARFPIGLYMQGWETNLQASYQCLALRYYLQTQGHTSFEVQGVLVNVIEKPEIYIPKRKCRPCGEYYEFARWVPLGAMQYACPQCGGRQELKPTKSPSTNGSPPMYFRLFVQREVRHLAEDMEIICKVVDRMEQMQTYGLYSEPWTKANCVSSAWRRTCDYFGPHKNHIPTSECEEYEYMPDYRGLVTIEGAPE